MILRNPQQDQSWAGIQKFPEKPKKKSWNSSQTPRAGGNHGLYIPTGNPGGKRGKDSKKTAGKGFIQERKIREKCQDSIGIFMEKKKELKEWNQGMIGGKKKNGKKANQSHPAENFGSQIPRENSISSSTCNRKAGKAGIPSFPDGFWWENGIFLDSIQLEGIFLEFPFQGNVAVAMPGFFLGISGECWEIPEGWN